nr:cutinase transcription factor 1 beta [Quercus suber]
MYWLCNNRSRVQEENSKAISVRFQSICTLSVHELTRWSSPRKDTSAASSITPEPSASAIPSNVDMMPTPPRSIPSDTLQTPVFNGEPFNIVSNYMDTPQIPSHGTIPTFMSAPLTANMAVPSIAPIAPGKDVVMAGAMPFYSEKIDAATTQHHPIPQALANSMDHEDLAYAEAKGCFSIPSHQICEDLITAYFHYVHPMLPIIDQFASDSTLSMAGCKSRQELKKVMYGRAKCLHETGYEQDKITLIQSSLLLGFWYADLLDRAKSWHWTGVAISMAQTIGLHRDPGSRHFNSTISGSHRRIWANIWWSCFFRDRWLSFGYGRPLRINANDCDVPMPTSDCMMELPEQCPPAWRKYAPPELSQAAPIWLKLLELSQVLGDIMTSCYQPRRAALDAKSIEILEQRILDAQPEKQSLVATSELLLFFEAYTRLHVE